MRTHSLPSLLVSQPSDRSPFSIPTRVVHRVVAGVLLAMVPLAGPGVILGQPVATEEDVSADLPPVPDDASAKDLIAYIDELRANARPPRSRPEQLAYLKALFGLSLEASERALKQVKADSPLFEQASQKKLEALAMLSRTGDETTATQFTTYAKQLANGPSPSLAREAKRMLVLIDAQKMIQGEVALVDSVIKGMSSLLADDPDDPQSAQLAMQLAQALERLPDGDNAARSAYAAFGPFFAKSQNEGIRQLATSFEGVLRRLNLPGNPIDIEGTLLDKSDFNPASLQGKVVLVDFWATWCGPCVAEIPNVMAAYEKYHDKGFEVIGISLDEDAQAVADFVEERKIPWPILFGHEGGGWKHPMATKYGINGIPTVILVGQNGKVVSLDARGEKLGEQLEKLFANAEKQ